MHHSGRRIKQSEKKTILLCPYARYNFFIVSRKLFSENPRETPRHSFVKLFCVAKRIETSELDYAIDRSMKEQKKRRKKKAVSRDLQVSNTSREINYFELSGRESSLEKFAVG